MARINRGGIVTWVPHPRAEVTKEYHVRDSQYAAGYHTGTDIAVPGSGGQKIVWAPPVKGKVVKRGWDPKGYGNYVIIESDNGRQWLLAHMEAPGPREGTVLWQGDKIGNIGSTGNSGGPHLHLEEGKKGSDWMYGIGKDPRLGFESNSPHKPALASLAGGLHSRTDSGVIKVRSGTSVSSTTPPPPPPATSSDGTTDGSSDNTQSPDPSDSTAPGTDSTTTADPSTGTNDGTDGTDTTDGTDSAPDTTADSTDTSTEGDGSGTADSSTDTTDTTQVDTKPKGAVADDSRMPGVNGAGAAANMSVNEVDISAAAQKSEALIAADLNKDGTVTAKEDTVLNAADRNQDGTVGAQELEKFVATADVNQDGALTRTESKAFKTIDSNDDNKISERELRAFRSVAGEDGEISRAEAKEALKAQIDNKQDQLEHDLAVEYLRRTNEQEGGSQAVGEQAAALVSAQQPKPNKPDNDGPGKKNKKNK